jgi:hypothetical protein
LGNNIIGDTTGCNITLLMSDLTGDPGLGNFIDDGAPGHGRVPLLAGSPAIDRGNNAVCSSVPSLQLDQLDTPRLGACDIGATEFYPIVTGLVQVTGLTTSLDATPVPGGPAGTFFINATLTNTSNQTIGEPFVEVVTLTGGNLLLNAEGGRGGVGARIKLPNGSTGFGPGASRTVQFQIGLQQKAPFTFFIDVFGK